MCCSWAALSRNLEFKPLDGFTGGHVSKLGQRQAVSSLQAIMHFLVNTVTRGLQQHLIRDLYREEHFDQLVREREDVAARRQECTAGLAALREAFIALERLPANLMSRVRSGSEGSQVSAAS